MNKEDILINENLLHNLGKTKENKEEFRKSLEEFSNTSIPEKIKWTNIEDFIDRYNKLKIKYRSEMDKLYSIYQKGYGGPGEFMLCYLCDEFFISDKPDVDLKTPIGYIEVKEGGYRLNNEYFGTFSLGAKYSNEEKVFIEGILDLIDYVSIKEKNVLNEKDLNAIQKYNMNTSTIKKLKKIKIKEDEAINKVIVDKKGNIFIKNRKIGNIFKDGKKILESISLKSFDFLEKKFSKKIEKLSTKFIFIKNPKNGKEGLNIRYFEKLKDVELAVIDQNGPKFHMNIKDNNEI
jgi:hypothetical protein